MKLKDIGEDGIISLIKESFENNSPRVLRSIGDDTAVTTQESDKLLLSTTDILVEGVHFDRTCHSPFDLGRKSVNISTSDIASMGGTSLFILMSIALPKDTDKTFIEELYKGIKSACSEIGLSLIGGNTSLSPHNITIGSTVLGESYKDTVVYRSGANVGDRIFVTGTLGDSSLGLKLLRDGKTATNNATVRHLNPKARTEEGRLLAEHKIASSMIDISDGIASDINHISKESNVGATIFCHKIPLSTEMIGYLKDNPTETELPLSGGEDYELLFTVPENKLEELEKLKSKLPSPITEIGIITETNQAVLFLDEQNTPITIKTGGFKHF